MKLRQRYPRLRMVGHFDKMTMNRGEAAMRAEFERLVPLMKTGGFIPSVDHQTPPGVSLERIWRLSPAAEPICRALTQGARRQNVHSICFPLWLCASALNRTIKTSTTYTNPS